MIRQKAECTVHMFKQPCYDRARPSLYNPSSCQTHLWRILPTFFLFYLPQSGIFFRFIFVFVFWKICFSIQFFIIVFFNTFFVLFFKRFWLNFHSSTSILFVFWENSLLASLLISSSIIVWAASFKSQYPSVLSSLFKIGYDN